ncbi:MAG: site-specific integrase, partial [Propionibacteriaceae bacterium]
QVSGAALAELEDAGRHYDAKSRADRTWLGYQRDWRHFSGWCDSHGRPALPASPETVALYLADAARSFKVSTLRRRLAAISVVHQGYGHDSPTTAAVVRTRMAGIARANVDQPVERKAAAWGKDVRRMVATLPDDGARSTLARAVLTVGFAGGFRRSELVALDVGDVAETDDGLVLRIRRSKTDQEGAGRSIGIPYGPSPVSCPVRALRAWRQVNDADTGALFRSVLGHGQGLLGGRLSDRGVARIVKAGAVRIGADPATFAGHSLRAGFVTSAADGGASEAAIMNQTGHHSSEQVRAYMRDGRLFHNNAATVTGL